MAIKWRSKVILAKIEDTYKTDPTPTGAANAILMQDVELRPMEGQDVPRNLDTPFMGAQEQLPAGIYVVLTGTVELAGSGAAGTAPAWGPLIRACGVAETITEDTSVVYNPVSSDHESITVYVQVGPTLHKILGVRGTAVISVPAQGIPTIQLTLTGLFSAPVDASAPTPDYSAWQKPKVASDASTPTFEIGGVDFVLRSFSLDLGCDVQPRLLIGSETIQIVDKPGELVTANVEAVPLATYNPYSAAAGAGKAISLTHESTPGRIVSLSVPLAVQRRLTGFDNQQGIVEWPLTFTPSPDEGDDQWTITLT